MQHIQLSSESLYLREIEPGDLSDIYAFSKREDVHRYTITSAKSKEQTREHIEKVLRDQIQKPRTEIELAILLRERQKLIGTVDMTVDHTNKEAEIGYVLHPKFRNRGYATEAVRLLIDCGFNNFGLHRIFAKTDIENIMSQKLLERLRFRREGTFYEHLLIEGQRRSSHYYGLLRREHLAENSPR